MIFRCQICNVNVQFHILSTNSFYFLLFFSQFRDYLRQLYLLLLLSFSGKLIDLQCLLAAISQLFIFSLKLRNLFLKCSHRRCQNISLLSMTATINWVSVWAGPASHFEAVVILLRDGELVGLGVVADGVIIDPFLGATNRVCQVLLQRSILLAVLRLHIHV